MSRTLVLGALAVAACTTDDNDGPRIYAPTETLAFDCQAGPGKTVDLRRPSEMLGDDLVSSDGGVTWRHLVDEAAQPIRLGAGGTGTPYSLGDGRWFALHGDGAVVIDAPSRTTRTVALAAMLGPDLQFRAGDLGDGTFVGVGGRGRHYRSDDGLTWNGLDGEFYGGGLATGCTLWARGQRVWSLCPNAGHAVEVSTDGGRTFTSFTTPEPFTHLIHLAIGADGTLVAIFADDARAQQPWISVSDDGGATWRYGGGESEWIFRQTTVRVYVLDDGTILANADLNIDAAAPNPAGRYWLMSGDRAETWSIVRATSEGEELRAFAPAMPSTDATFAFMTADALCSGPVAGPGRFSRAFTIE